MKPYMYVKQLWCAKHAVLASSTMGVMKVTLTQEGTLSWITQSKYSVTVLVKLAARHQLSARTSAAARYYSWYNS